MEKSQNNKIEELEKNSKQLLEQAEEFYKQIGKKYYEIHSTDAEECIRDEVEKLNEINIQLKYISEQIEAYINGHICTACGGEISEDDRFCPNCGKQIIRENTSTDNGNMQCPRCGEVYEEHQKFCSKCGFLLSGEEMKQNILKEEQKESMQHVCPNCGAETDENMKFCIICGKKLK